MRLSDLKETQMKFIWRSLRVPFQTLEDTWDVMAQIPGSLAWATGYLRGHVYTISCCLEGLCQSP